MMDPTAERSTVIAQLESAVAPLAGSISAKLIPPSGAQVGYAIRGARDKNGVAAIEGRITRAGAPAGLCAFGVDEEIARVILTVMKFDPLCRSAALLRCSDRALDVLDGDLFLECVSYDAMKAPKGISTMDWGIASCCRDEIPDVIYAEGGRAASSPLIVLAEEPVDVVNNIIICSNRI
ncbi:MAG TPA: thiamine-phosphate synthase family protein [Methanoregula sp.]|nr:thiamine-phosphate synthase family protein [Methanoregula sp.]